MNRFTYTKADSVPLSLLAKALKSAFKQFPELGMQDNTNARHIPEFVPALFGYRNRLSMLAEASAVDADFPRFPSSSAILDWVADRTPAAFEKTFRVRIPAEMVDVLVIAMAQSLSLFRVCQLAENNPVDKLLIRAGAQPFEFATLKVTASGGGEMLMEDTSYAFCFQDARDKFAQLPEDWQAGQSEADQINYLNEHVVRPSWQHAIDVVTAGMRPDFHEPVAVIDADGLVVGITFIHTIHGGIVPGLCSSPKDMTTMLRNLVMGYAASQGMESHKFNWSTHSSYMVTDGTRLTPSASFVKISFDHAYRIAGQLKKARNGVRVSAPQGKRVPLLNAHIRAQEVIHGGNGKGHKTMLFGISTITGGPVPTGTMSLNGSMSVTGAQVYVRQRAWKDEADFPELFPAGRTMPLPEDTIRLFARGENGYTKVLPDYIRDFQERAEALLAHKCSPTADDKGLEAVASALAEQRALITRIVELEKATEEARKIAGFYKLYSVQGQIDV